MCAVHASVKMVQEKGVFSLDLSSLARKRGALSLLERGEAPHTPASFA